MISVKHILSKWESEESKKQKRETQQIILKKKQTKNQNQTS